MRDIIKFLDNYYEKALQLSIDFSVTRSYDWKPLNILNELSIQIGHIYNVVYKNSVVNESNRVLNNLGDELSDVILQLITLADSLKIDMYEIKNMNMFNEKDWLSLPILLGQLNEAVMEKEGYRFTKSREGYSSIEEFIKSRIFKLFIITYNISLEYKLDIEKEFELMLVDANKFLERFNKNIEYINVYDDIHNFKGVVPKHKAHKLGWWHEVVWVLIFNPITQNVFFQVKKHNNKDKLEITVGSHLKAGEDLKDIVREIKEETGLEVKYDDLIPCLTRKCDIYNGEVIREFQNFYLLPLDIRLDDFKENEEVNRFIQISIKDALNIVLYGIGIQSEMQIKEHGEIRDVVVTRDDLDEIFLNNNTFHSLLEKTREYIDERILKTKLNKAVKRKLKRIFKVVKLDKIIHSKNYYSDNGKTEGFIEIYKDNITYTIIKNNVDTSTNNYIVYLIIEFNNRTATKQLVEEFNNLEDADKYFNFLNNYIKENSNEIIINDCYRNLNDKSLLVRFLSLIG